MTDRPMVRIGLTGSIGMGKSTVAGFFAERGVRVYCADETVHALYGGRAAPAVEALFPGTVENGRVNRQALSARVLGDDAALARLEALVHPMVREEEERFARAAEAQGATMALFDIPLLLETGREGDFDAVIVVSAPEPVQRARVLARPGMSTERFEAILAKQMPDAQKRRRAAHVIDTGAPAHETRAAVHALYDALSRPAGAI